MPYYRYIQHDFNPLRPRGRRPIVVSVGHGSTVFQLTPPARTETATAFIASHTPLFQPTPPARTETINEHNLHMQVVISTHSAREDGD